MPANLALRSQTERIQEIAEERCVYVRPDYDPVEHVVRGLFDGNIKGKYAAMYSLYFDDSGTHLKSSIAVAAAWVAPVTQWKKFSKEITAILEEEEFPFFHMAEFAGRHGHFKGWKDEKWYRVGNAIRDLIRKRAVKGFGVAVKKSDYDELVTGYLKTFTGEHHYTWAVANCFGLVEVWRKNEQIRDPITYFFDQMKQGTKEQEEINQLFAKAGAGENAAKYGINSPHAFGDKKIVKPLQAADALAWSCLQAGLNAMRGNEPSPIAKNYFDSFNLGHKLIFGFYKRHHLAEWVQKEEERLAKQNQ